MTIQDERYVCVLDTETSGLTGKDRIIEFGLIVLNEDSKVVYKGSDYCSIPFELSHEVSEYTGIKNSDLKDAKKIKDTPTYHEFMKYNNKNNRVVIHNSWFDLYMLYLSHIKVECQIIDTLNCARHEYTLDSYSLESIMNNVVKKSDTKAYVQKHRAIDDCEDLLTVLNCLMKKNTLAALVKMTDKVIIGFGKHKGKLWTELDEGYLKWVHDKFAQENSPTQLYVKSLLKMEMSPQQKKMAEYLHIISA